MDNALKDTANTILDGHVLIKDVDTGEVLLDKHNSINLINIAYSIASLLGGKLSDSNNFNIVKVVYGNGGTEIDSNGNISYKTPNTDSESGTLYNETYFKMVDGTASNASENIVEVQQYLGQPYSDVIVTSTIEYNKPDATDLSGIQRTVDDASGDASDSTGSGSPYIFDELGLINETGNQLSHIVFHPIEKSANRKIQIIYTIRIRAGS